MRNPEMNLEDWLNLVTSLNPLFAERAPQCAYETLESRKGACDGGERCRNQATCEVDGVPYCNRHGMN